MKRKLAYMELKSGYSDNGPAWIGLVAFSKSGQTLYFDNKALKKQKIPQDKSNHYDLETGEKYWVSGVKKNGKDRHPAGNGKIMIDKKSVEDYLTFRNLKELNLNQYEIIEFEETDMDKFKKMENIIMTDEMYQEMDPQFWDKNSRKFEI